MDLSYSCVWLKMVVCDWLLTRHVTRHSFTYFAFLHLLALHWNCTETAPLLRAIEIGGIWLAADVSRDSSLICISCLSIYWNCTGTALKPHWNCSELWFFEIWRWFWYFWRWIDKISLLVAACSVTKAHSIDCNDDDVTWNLHINLSQSQGALLNVISQSQQRVAIDDLRTFKRNSLANPSI